ncbi:unnamed protein product [Effrenium voratum]|uniref:Exostosin GT47 domain-containing protein n=1 Tax=Effrenium voratum TaxID=2562239 RepID=A0AA36HN65_9DINO|nr:unnamed protein product [Effrenium voratum]
MLPAALVLALPEQGVGLGNDACWRGGFSFEDCCKGRGRPECFDALYTFEVCCLDAKAALPQDCHQDVESLARHLQCKGTQWVKKEDWDSFFLAHQLSQSLGASYKGWPDIGELLRKANATTGALRATEEDCRFGLAALLLQALPSLERAGAHGAVRAAYRRARRLSLAGGEDCRWREMVNHAILQHTDMLLGADRRFRGWCPANGPKIFVYELPLARNPLSCARIGFWASEVYLERFLFYSGCRTSDPEEADLFFVPAYLTCWELQHSKPLSALARAEFLDAQRGELGRLPFLGARGGLDHVFLFGASAWQLPRWRSLLKDSIVLAVESQPIESDGTPEDETRCWHCTDCFQPWKDLVVPPVTPLPGARALLARAKPFHERQLLMTWHGQHADSESAAVRRAYRITNETVRTELIHHLSHLPDVSIGSPISDYAGVMGNAKFCLCPKGASSYTSRTFEALFAGCIPVILSDHVRLPFDHVLNWSDFSIAWPMARADMSLYHYLQSFDEAEALAMQQRGAEARCWFDYFAQEQEPQQCSPYLAVLMALQGRAIRRKRQHEGPRLTESAKARMMPDSGAGPGPGASLIVASAEVGNAETDNVPAGNAQRHIHMLNVPF